MRVDIALELIKSGQKSEEMRDHLCLRKGDLIARQDVMFFRLKLNGVLKGFWILKIDLEMFLTYHLLFLIKQSHRIVCHLNW